MPFHVVEDEELGFRSEQRAVGDTGRAHVLLGARRDGARVAVVALLGVGLEDVAAQDHGRLLEEGVEHRALVVGHQQHVGGVDRLPARDGAAVEHLAVLEEVGGHFAGGDREVLFLALRVGESKIDPLDVVFLDQFESLFRHGFLRAGSKGLWARDITASLQASRAGASCRTQACTNKASSVPCQLPPKWLFKAAFFAGRRPFGARRCSKLGRVAPIRCQAFLVRIYHRAYLH